MEGSVVFLRRANPEAPGSSVGGGAIEKVVRGESGLDDSGHSVLVNPIRIEGSEEEDS
jgi:hypothetical protein